MQMQEQRLLEFLGQPDILLTIPRYQRSYSWQERQCMELWRDLARAAREHRTHFLGTLIYQEEGMRPSGEASEELRTIAVVDGQQRLTTIAILLMALARHLGDNGALPFGLDSQFVRSTYLSTGGHGKIELSPADDATFSALALGQPLGDHPAKNVMDTYRLFCSLMNQEGFDAAALWSALESLVVISVSIDDAAQAPDVFESLNSKGVPLTTADLVRNYLLIARSHHEQKRLYETYWQPLSGAFGDDPGSLRLNGAIEGWLSVRFTQVRKLGDKDAFSIFKSYCEDEYDGTVDDLLDELYSFCLVWAENYRYHAVKKYKSADWAKIGRKTRVSGRPRAKLDNPQSAEYYKRHFGVDPQW